MADVEPTELAYLAGFFDGEGSVGIYTRKYTANVTNCDPRILLRYQTLWGGSIHKAKRREFTVKDKYQWQMYGQKSRLFLEAVLPYVITKKVQIEIYLATLKIIPKRNGEKRLPGVGKIVSLNADRLKQLKREVS